MGTIDVDTWEHDCMNCPYYDVCDYDKDGCIDDD